MTRAEVLVTRHPIGLAVLFLTEMWERFSYYGMKAILMYFMLKHLLLAQDKASLIYGLYAGLAYLTMIIGGVVADRYLGRRKTVVVGGSLMAAGQFILAYGATLDATHLGDEFWPKLGSASGIYFILGLIFLVLGTGLFKPNISTQVRSLYPPGDARLDAAFSIFFVGINAGALFAPLICGTLGELYGWPYGFLAAGIGMVGGLLIYLCGQKYLGEEHEAWRPSPCRSSWRAIFQLTPSEKAAIRAILILAAFNVVNWVVYEQQGNVMAVWFDKYTNRHLFAWVGSFWPAASASTWMADFINYEVPATWFQAVTPFFIFGLTPLVLWFWRWQQKKGREPTTIGKFGLGCFIFGLSYIFMLLACREKAQLGMASAGWPLAFALVLTVGELYISPVGLSFVAKTAPPRMISTVMGLWFLSSFAGNLLSGYLGSCWQVLGDFNFFALMGCLPIGAGIGIFALRHFLERSSAVTVHAAKTSS